tara:strand:+ start:16226 stop:18571 length:2346 start_codon:yes stop_codon:yes gene_type:complete
MKFRNLIAVLLTSNLIFTNELPNEITSKLNSFELAAFENLPESTKESIISRITSASENQIFSDSSAIVSSNESIEDSVLSINDYEEYDSSMKIKKFGYDFFSGIPTTFTPINDVPIPGSYVIGIGDLLQINFKGEKSGIYDIEVSKNGQIYIPEIGEIAVNNLTFDEVKNKITDAFNSFYLSVEANVTLKELKFISVSVLGAVNNPGRYLVNPFTSASNLLSFAGGLEDYASLRNIELRGSRNISIDLYDYLINGEKEDITLRGGDILYVPSTSNFIFVNGAVNRPAIYEFLDQESIEDLIGFAQNFSRMANKDFFQIKELSKDQIISKLTTYEKNLDLKNITEIFIPEISRMTVDNIYVYGNVSDLGPFEVNEHKTLSELLDKISFTNDLYPYFGILESTSDTSYKNEYYAFSIDDDQSQKNLQLKPGSKIYLFSKDIFLGNTEYPVELNSPIQKIIDGHSIKFNGEFLNNASIPVFGKVKFSSLIDYVGGFAPTADKKRLEIIYPLEEKTISNPDSDYFLNSPLGASINVPKYNSEIIQVTINGEIRNPGTYPILSGTTLDELYQKAGNFKDTASSEAVVFLREELKDKESAALEIAKVSLINAFIDSLSTTVALTNQTTPINAQLLSLLDQSSNLKPLGRLSGDLSPGSEFSSKLILQNGDSIFIPTAPQTVTVFGEVNNQSTINFNDEYGLNDYLNASGGLKSSADKKNIFVIRSNGTSYTLEQKLFQINKESLRPGDTIIVPKDIDRIDGLPLVKVATDILSGLAFSAASLNALNN